MPSAGTTLEEPLLVSSLEAPKPCPFGSLRRLRFIGTTEAWTIVWKYDWTEGSSLQGVGQDPLE